MQPRAIAVVGASPTAGKVGYEVMRALKGATCPVYPVHPRATEILGTTVYPDVTSLPEPVDLAVIATGADAAVDAALRCAEHGIPYVVVLASGFSETDAAGARREETLLEAVRKGTRILGPNTLGLQVPFSGVDTIFVEHATDSVAGGSIALVSQSGSVAVEALLAAARTGFGLRAFLGLGNKVDLAEIDFLEYFANDPETRCVALYLEDLSAGRRFLNLASEIAAERPVLAIKAGRTKAGASAASSHTGRLSGSDRVVDGALTQHRIQRVYDDEELCDAAKVLNLCRVPRGNRVAILSPAGGYGVMLADLVETPLRRVRLEIAQLDDRTGARLRTFLPGFASARNPVDLTASVDDDMVIDALNAVAEDPGVDVVVCVHFLAPPGLTGELTSRIAAAIGTLNKPVVVLAGDEDGTGDVLRQFYREGVAAFPSVARVGTALRALELRRCTLKRAKGPGGTAAGTPQDCGTEPHPGDDGRRRSARLPAGLPDQPFDEKRSKNFLSQFGIPFPRAVLMSGRSDTLEVPDISAAGLGEPLVVKVCSPDILHKTESGGVIVQVTRAGLADAVATMRARFPRADVLIEEMIRHAGVELICGAFRDPELGPCVMVGTGGVFAELQNDVSFRLLPCTRADAVEMIDELAVSPVFDGYRGMPCSREDLADIILGVGRAVGSLGDRFEELDLNPIVCAESGMIALDAMIVTAPR